MKFNERMMVLTDLETSSLDPYTGDILQIGGVRFNQDTLEIEALFQVKTPLYHPENADPISLEINGYTREAWSHQVSLYSGLKSFFAFARQAVFSSYVVQFDWNWLRPHIAEMYSNSEDRDVRRFGPFDRHLIDIPSIAWGVLGSRGSFSKDAIAKELGLEPEPKPHDALTGALHGLEVLRALRRRFQEVQYVKAA